MTARGLATEVVALIALALLFAMLGPFGTFAMPWPLRTLDWMLFMLGGGLLFRPVIGAARLLARHGALRLPAALALACALAAFPTTVLVAWCLAGLGWRGITLETLVILYPEVLLIGGVATGLHLFFATHRRVEPDRPKSRIPSPTASAIPADDAQPEPPQPPATVPALSPAPGARFFERLPPTLGCDLLCLENEDHYVRAHTAKGSVLILMRLGDAIAELAGVEGARTHRSWWVARRAVSAVVRKDRAIVLRLRNGLEVPVARTMAQTLRERGWLEEFVAPRQAG